MKFSFPLFITLAAVATSTAVAKKTRVKLEALVVIQTDVNRPLNAAEETVMGKCMVSAFNAVHDSSQAVMKSVGVDPENPRFLQPNREIALDSVPTGYRVRPLYRWKIVSVDVCRDCPTDCPPSATSWMCKNAEEATLLTDAQYFQAHESARHLEWEAGVCDCLNQSQKQAFIGATDCRVSFPPPPPTDLLDFTTPIIELENEDSQGVMQTGDDTTPDDITHTVHTMAVIWNSQSGQDLTKAEEVLLDQCLLDSFNSMKVSSGTIIEAIGSVPENPNFVSTDLNAILRYTPTFYRYPILAVCRLCPQESCPVTAYSWMCAHPEEVKFLTDVEHARLTLTDVKDEWERTLCSCLLESQKESFMGAQNCQITFPPLVERALDDVPSLRGGNSARSYISSEAE